MNINLIQGSILTADTDTIVNPANSFLRHGGGLAKVIAQACAPRTQPGPQNDKNGPQRAASAAWWAEQHDHPSIATGDAAWTSAGRLSPRYKGIVHAVGPIWRDGSLCEEDLLYAAHISAMRVASEHGCTSIAFPAISCGLFRFPVKMAAEIALSAVDVNAEDWGIERADFFLLEDAHLRAYGAAQAIL